jgi:hypothetical protein
MAAEAEFFSRIFPRRLRKLTQAIWDLGFGIWDLESGILESGILEFGISAIRRESVPPA